MHKFTLKKILLTTVTLLSVCISSYLTAKTTKVKDYYQIELIIFKNNSKELLKNENWPLMELIIPQNAIKITSYNDSSKVNYERYNPNYSETTDTSTNNKNNYYQTLRSDDLLQKIIADKISNNSRYTIISHIGFRVPKKDVENPKPIYFETGKIHQVITNNKQIESNNTIEAFNNSTVELETSEISGLLKLQQKKFVHSELELLLTHPALITHDSQTPFELVNKTNAINIDHSSSSDDFSSNENSNNFDNNLYLQSFKLSEKRRLKSNELNYFDHPVFGAIVSIS